MGDALVAAQDPACFIYEVTGNVLFSGVPPDEGGVVSVRDKADVLAVRLPGIEKALAAGNLPGLRFAESPQGEAGVGQLVLGQHIEYVTLVLAGVQGLFQQIPAVFLLNAGIVAGGDGIAAHEGRPVIETPEFQIAVAVNTGIGRPALLIGIGKSVHYLAAELIREVEHIVRHIQLAGHAAGILHIVQRAAGAAAGEADVLVAVEGHGGAGAVPALPLHEVSGDAGINAAAHCNQCFFHQTMGQPPSQCSQSGNLLWS